MLHDTFGVPFDEIVLERGGAVRAVARFTIVDHRIVAIDLVLDPEKLRRLSVS